jgi:peptidyl-tRNA hydrolase
MNTRHVVVVRKDLDMSAGLMSAQVAHISDMFMRRAILDNQKFTDEQLAWMKDPYISVLGVNNKEELDIVCSLAIAQDIDVHVWTDLIYSNILKRGKPDVVVGESLGPCDMDRLKAITGTLPLA